MSAATTIAACAKAIANAWKAFCMAVDAEPAKPADDIDLSGAIWGGGVRAGDIKTTQRITSFNFTGTHIVVETTPGTRVWSPTRDGCNQYSCLAVIRDGKTYSAKFDWQRPGNSPRDLDNIFDNYMGWIPSSGETVYYFQTNLGLTERTNAVAFIWP